MQFPSDWPESCPPGDAVDADGEVFRIVSRVPLAAEDFLTSFENGAFPHRPPCLRCGLSVHQILSDAIHTRTKYPKLGSRIARATLAKDFGKMKPTGAGSHITWWVYKGVNRAGLFSLVVEEG